jgi:hypothetical protein
MRSPTSRDCCDPAIKLFHTMNKTWRTAQISSLMLWLLIRSNMEKASPNSQAPYPTTRTGNRSYQREPFDTMCLSIRLHQHVMSTYMTLHYFDVALNLSNSVFCSRPSIKMLTAVKDLWLSSSIVRLLDSSGQKMTGDTSETSSTELILLLVVILTFGFYGIKKLSLLVARRYSLEPKETAFPSTKVSSHAASRSPGSE